MREVGTGNLGKVNSPATTEAGVVEASSVPEGGKLGYRWRAGARGSCAFCVQLVERGWRVLFDSNCGVCQNEVMTKALQEIFEDLTRLPDSEQDAIAAVIRAEYLSEKGWEERFSGSPEVLEKLASEALNEIEAGTTKPLMTDGDFTHD